ncbi:MAG: DUF1460 domain-containing protein [Muribaculaceae bacterium]|nr:DUF1460 domain-containing protein [Muribaculaceae bacterium]
MKRIVLYIAVMCCFAVVNGATMEQMRFHCTNDTLRINELLQKGYQSNCTSASELVVFYAKQLLGTPYVGHTLEGDKEMLTINIDELDCTTFVETLYALTRTTLDKRYSWRDYAANLESIRYRGGIMGDYASRLHYISEWIIDNNSRGNLTEITSDIPHSQPQIKTINFMSQHVQSYSSLKNDPEMVEKIIKAENKLRNHRMNVLRKSWLGDKQVKAVLHDGDFIGLVTKIEGLDISHLGIIIKDENGYPHLLDASMSGGKVMLEDKPLKQYLSGSRSTVTGIRVFRIKND